MSRATGLKGDLALAGHGTTGKKTGRTLRSTGWLKVSGGAAVLALAVYAVNAAVGIVHPASTWGIWYGAVATGLLVVALAYGVRRRTLFIRAAGPSRGYLLAHVYGGALFLLLALMHSGFTLPEGVITWILWVLGLWVVGTGFLGVAIQKWCSASLAQLGTEVQLGRIGELSESLRGQAEQVAREAGGLIQDFYVSELAPAMEAPRFRWRSLTGFVRDRNQRFGYMRSVVAPERQDNLEELRRLVRARAEMDVHFALQSVLRRWLWLHVPTAVMLAAVLALHIGVTLYY